MHKFRPILFALLLVSVRPLAANCDEIAVSNELYSAPVQGVKAGVSPCILAITVGAVVGVAALILSQSNVRPAVTHSHGS